MKGEKRNERMLVMKINSRQKGIMFEAPRGKNA